MRVLDQIISKIEADPKWFDLRIERPRNIVTGKPYSGINMWNLGASKWWATFPQIKTLGGKVIKGSKSSSVIWFDKKDIQSLVITSPTTLSIVQDETLRCSKYSNVFSLDQLEDIEEPTIKQSDDKEPKDIIAAYIKRDRKLTMSESMLSPGLLGYYDPGNHKIVISKNISDDKRVSVTYHEMIHSTQRILSRNLETPEEELVAEMGAAMLCALSGIYYVTKKEHKDYISFWQKQITNKITGKKYLSEAAKYARQGITYILEEKK